MKRTKAPLTIFILLLFHIMTLAQEVSINHVLCHKSNARVDLEVAVQDFVCPCEHDHGLNPASTDHSLQQRKCCFDIPFHARLFDRIRYSVRMVPGTRFLSFFPDPAQSPDSSRSVAALHGLGPPRTQRKFLHPLILLPSLLNTILLC